MTDQIRVLAIDDSEDDRALYRRALSRNGERYEVSESEDGDEGLARIDKENPHCILLDYSLPGRNGIEILKRLRVKHPFIPVVMLTGQGNEEIAVAAMREGAQNYLTKSAVNAEEIHRTIQLAIAHCAMERRIDQQRVSLETFTRALAHDLKEPVRTISSFLGLIDAHQTFVGRERGYFQHIQNAATRMGALIDAVHYYTRLSDPAQEPAGERCDANTLFEEAKADIAELIREKGAHVTAGSLPQIEGNPMQLRRVLQNLICNALRHTPDAPVVYVDAIDRGDHWMLRVADNGAGVDVAAREKIFEPFVRLTRRREDGLGLGLAICRRIVESRGGKIWCEQSGQGGALFCFTLPKAAPADEVNAMEMPMMTNAQCRSNGDRSLASVLIVDDNEVDLELARIILLEEDRLRCDLLVANGGEEALAILQAEARHAQPIDLLLLDINMPGMDGFALLDRIRGDETLRHVPVVMCTTSNYDKDVARARALGASGYVTKPARLDSLKLEFNKISALELVDELDGHTLVRTA